jgi:hypothetical protein
MPYEQMDDLQLAVETVLGKHGARGETATVEFEIGPDALLIGIGPLSKSLGDTGNGDELDTKRLLGALVERVEVIERDGQTWLRLEDGIRSRA